MGLGCPGRTGEEKVGGSGKFRCQEDFCCTTEKGFGRFGVSHSN